MDSVRQHPLLRPVAVAALCVVVICLGLAVSSLAASTYTIPGTTITVATNADGTINVDKLNIPGIPPGYKLPEGITIPKGQLTVPKELAGVLPKDISGLLAALQQGGTSTGSTLPTTSIPAAASVPPSDPAAPAIPVTPTQPDPAASSPIPGIPSFGGAATTATTTTTATNKTNDQLATLLLIVVGAILLAVALLFAVARLSGWEPEWWTARRHQSTEAAWRASNSWADFRDWLRVGR